MFIKSRDIAKNITPAHELCPNLLSNHFVAKLDLKKAFDSINSLYISNAPFSIILEGEIKSYFLLFKGLRQGCPLSPFSLHYCYGIILYAYRTICDSP